MSNNIYVPITLKGLVVGNPPEDTGDYPVGEHRYADINDDYSRIIYSPLGEYIPAQLSVQDDVPKGVHLHWSLPDALTRGYMDENGIEPQYPAVPDRWILTRIWAPINDYNKALLSRSWMIISNALFKECSAKNGNDGSMAIPYDDPVTPYRYLGKSVPLSGYKGDEPENSEYLKPLTAMIAGNPIYGAYYPTSRNVFGFYDDMTDEKGKPVTDAAVTYCVIGYFADTDMDPLKRDIRPYKDAAGESVKDISAVLEYLKWEIVPNGAGKAAIPAFPCKTICHGMLCDITWYSGDASYVSGIPEDLPEIAVGNSSAEALAALIARKSTENSNEVENLECILTHMLAGMPKEVDAQDGLSQSESSIHERRFGIHSVYTQYSLKPPDTHGSTIGTEPGAELAALLDKVNGLLWKQQRLEYETQTCQEKVFDLWYRYEKMADAPKNLRNDCIEALKKEAEQIFRIREELVALNIDRYTADLKKLCEKEAFTLLSDTGQRFYEPFDPVILLAGIKRDFSHGEDGCYSNNGLLPVRTKTISAFSVSGKAQLLPFNVTVQGSELLKGSISTALKEEYAAVLNECALISPSFCMQAARLMCASNSAGKKESVPDVGYTYRRLQQYGVLGCTLAGAQAMAALSASTGMNAPFPEKTAVEYWTQAWYPLHMEWVADYYPDEPSVKTTPSIGGWKSGHVDGKFQYDFEFKGEMPANSVSASFSGRALITPHAAYNLADKLAELNEVIPNAGCISVLSQSLGSLHSQLLMVNRLPMTARYEYADKTTMVINPDTKQNVCLYKLMNDIMRGFSPRFPIFDTLFAPVRAGFMRIREISVIDVFGRMQRLPRENITITAAESVRAAETIKTESGSQRMENLIVLPPRLLEPAQIRFDWKNDDRKGPICGFLLPNFIDRNMLVFSSEGKELGSIQSIRYAGEAPVVWKRSIADGGGTSNPKKDIKDFHLLTFVESILTRAQKESSVFETLLGAVNAAMWQINPHLHNNAGTMGLMFGQPLALARAELSLRTMGPPRRYKAFDITNPKNPDVYPDVNIEALTADITVGIPHKHGDGTLGFFLNGKYETLCWSYPPEQDKIDGYIKYNPVIRLSPYFEERNPEDITLLLDPLGEINIHSGLLPVKSVRLEQNLVEHGLKELYHVSLIAPALQYGLETRLPLPKAEGRRWVWAGFEGADRVFRADKDVVSATPDTRFEDEPVCAREGWICLRDSSE